MFEKEIINMNGKVEFKYEKRGRSQELDLISKTTKHLYRSLNEVDGWAHSWQSSK